jgi:hypothetical protein
VLDPMCCTPLIRVTPVSKMQTAGSCFVGSKSIKLASEQLRAFHSLLQTLRALGPLEIGIASKRSPVSANLMVDPPIVC